MSTFNAEDYGAVNDGVTDDSAAIQAAENAAENGGGGTVALGKSPLGTLIGNAKAIGTEITLGSNVTLDGNGATIIARGRTEYGAISNKTIDIRNTDHAIVQNLTMNGEGRFEVGIQMDGVVSDVMVRSVWLHDFDNYALTYGDPETDPAKASFRNVTLDGITITGTSGSGSEQPAGINFFSRTQNGDMPTSGNLIIENSLIDVSNGSTSYAQQGPQAIKLNNLDGATLRNLRLIGGDVAALNVSNGSRNVVGENISIYDAAAGLRVHSHFNTSTTLTQDVSFDNVTIARVQTGIQVSGVPLHVHFSHITADGGIALQNTVNDDPPGMAMTDITFDDIYLSQGFFRIENPGYAVSNILGLAVHELTLAGGASGARIVLGSINRGTDGAVFDTVTMLQGNSPVIVNFGNGNSFSDFLIAQGAQTGGTIFQDRGTNTSFASPVVVSGAIPDTFLVAGTTGNDLIEGSKRSDQIAGFDGNDFLSGGDGIDKLNGGSGADTMTGGAGDDTLIGGDGKDVMSGGAGNDTYVVTDARETVIEQPDEGIDLVRSSISYALTANVENLRLTGSAAINGAGNELDNTLAGNTANNQLNGGSGNDTVDYSAETTPVVVNLASGTASGSHIGADTLISIENILGSNGRDVLTGDGDANHLVGNGGADTLTGGAGGDFLEGGTGADILDGGAGADTMAGGVGDDTYYVDDANDIVQEKANEGSDTVISAISYLLPDNVEALQFSGLSGLTGTGNGLANTIIGTSGDDNLLGRGGDDVLSAGGGNNTLTGGGGHDHFVISTSPGLDTVTDFQAGPGFEDVLDLTAYNLTFNQLVVADSPDGALITLPGGREVLLEGVAVSNLGADDFAFKGARTVYVETQASESSGEALVTFRLDAAKTGTVRVTFATVDGTALAVSGDYTATSRTITFAPGQTIVQVAIPVSDNQQLTSDKTFDIQITAITGALAATVTPGAIADDDHLPAHYYSADVLPDPQELAPSGFNDRGAIVGTIDGPDGNSLPHIYDHGLSTTLTLPGGNLAGQAIDINDAGEVTGFFVGAGHSKTPFLYNASDGLLTANMPSGLTTGIDASGQSVGYAVDGFVWDGSANPMTVDGQLVAINAAGEAVGVSHSHPFIWSEADGGEQLALPNGMDAGIASAINDRGEIAGSFVGSGLPGPVGFVWTSAGGYQLIGGPDEYLQPMFITNDGVVIGRYEKFLGLDAYGSPSFNHDFFRWTAEEGVTRFSKMGLPHITDILDVNAFGQILAYDHDSKTTVVLTANLDHAVAESGFWQNADLDSGNGKILIGTSSAESIVGTDGNDVIYGAGGADTLTGAAGQDWFVLSSNTAVTISDFSATVAGDTLDFGRMLGATWQAGAAVGQPADILNPANGYFELDDQAAGTMVRIDPDGSAGPLDFQDTVLLAGLHGLSLADLLAHNISVEFLS